MCNAVMEQEVGFPDNKLDAAGLRVHSYIRRYSGPDVTQTLITITPSSDYCKTGEMLFLIDRFISSSSRCKAG